MAKAKAKANAKPKAKRVVKGKRIASSLVSNHLGKKTTALPGRPLKSKASPRLPPPKVANAEPKSQNPLMRMLMKKAPLPAPKAEAVEHGMEPSGEDLDKSAASSQPKMKRRLHMWKSHAARLGTEAPLPSAEPSALAPRKHKMKKRSKEELKAERIRLKDEASRVDRAPRRNTQGMIDASESAANESLIAGDTSLEALQRALDLFELPASANRKNVIPKGTAEIQGLLFGLYSYGGTLGVSAATTAHPNLCKLLVSAVQAIDADFPFTSIQLNFNYASRPHVDKNNLGCSYIVGFGDYEGGQLWMEDADAGTEGVSVTLPADDDDVTARYRAGSSFVGRVEDIKGRWIQFDGNALHYTRPFSGNRYSLIFFTSDQYKKVSEDLRNSLRSHGIDLDWENVDVQDLLNRKLADKKRVREQLAKERAEEDLRERMRRGRCVARIWADGWGHQCTAIAADGKDMCELHIKGNRWKTHGRFDGDLPPAKRDEMASTQRKWIKQGKRPPPDEPWTRLAELP